MEDDRKMDVMLMRSNSGNQILDIDFGAAEAAMMASSHAAVQGGVQGHHNGGGGGSVMHGGGGWPGGHPGAGYAVPMIGHSVMGVFNGATMQQQLGGMGSSSGGGTLGGIAHRKLKILEHHVHRIDTHCRDSGEPEEELVVSNLRHFTLKVAVVDSNESPILDCEMPLVATLLYENGLPVKQLSNSEPLLVGEPEVVALQGSAVFKLRITSLSSHRDKQRFRIQVAPQSALLRTHEPALTVVTDPMKSVTKLAHRAATPKEGGAHADEMGAAGDGGPVATQLAQHSAQIGQLQEMHALILKQLQDMNGLVRNLVTGQAGDSGLVRAPAHVFRPTHIATLAEPAESYPAATTTAGVPTANESTRRLVEAAAVAHHDEDDDADVDARY